MIGVRLKNKVRFGPTDFVHVAWPQKKGGNSNEMKKKTNDKAKYGIACNLLIFCLKVR